MFHLRKKLLLAISTFMFVLLLYLALWGQNSLISSPGIAKRSPKLGRKGLQRTSKFERLEKLKMQVLKLLQRANTLTHQVLSLTQLKLLSFPNQESLKNVGGYLQKRNKGLI